ncbi:N-acetylneuraminate synthase [Pseudomonas sp. S25]|uniref:N-acetylneuraminate synthase n=1 Tax=Pseudomonas maioricensis TaxID=1766623 RepID=A0ABS9ZLH0_9PSED|nr:N-acetylneuraminate synthase [Pseudomonas sp. S25]MCI8210377.1 N-acetylneuraminate synthase [Pseudomonas sp. S25]
MNTQNKDAVYIIAEAGVNHNGDRERAFELVDIAADAGADAVKFQTFDARKLASVKAPKAGYQKRTTDQSESQLEMLKKLELPREWHRDLLIHANKRGIDFLSTAFDGDSLDFLATLKIPLFKVPSGELTNGPLLWKFARTGLPLVLSTGMATLSEVEQGLAIIAHAKGHEREPASMEEVWKYWSQPDAQKLLVDSVTLLHCTSQYPTPLEEVNLRAMDTLKHAFGLAVGYSDHTEGLLVPVAAVARGAKVIEKHFTTDRSLPGPDHKASLEPAELREMVSRIRALEKILGDGRKAPHPTEWDTRLAAKQQVVAARAIPAGQTFVRDDLTTARCGAGLPAVLLWEKIGCPASRAYEPGEIIE